MLIILGSRAENSTFIKPINSKREGSLKANRKDWQFEVWCERKDLASVIDQEDLSTQYIGYATRFVRSLDEASSGRRSLVSDRYGLL